MSLDVANARCVAGVWPGGGAGPGDRQLFEEKRGAGGWMFGTGPPFTCPRCGRQYQYPTSVRNHLRLECGMEPQFPCMLCPYRGRRKHHRDNHMISKHNVRPDWT